MPFKKGNIPWNLDIKGIIPWNTGKNLSDEHKKKISIASAGKRNPNYGKKTSETAKEKMRLKLRGRKNPKLSAFNKSRNGFNRGENHYNWNPNKKEELRLRDSSEYKLWRKAVFERDGYACIWCGIRNIKGLGKTIVLHADHIKPFCNYPEIRFAIDNGRTLCVSCHKKTDTYGFKLMHKNKKHV